MSMSNESNKAEVYQLLVAKGYNANTIAGIMANIAVETGYTFDFTQQENKGTGGYGLFQLDPSGKKPEYDLWKTKTKREDSASAQIDFMHESIYTGITAINGRDVVGEGNRKKLRAAFESGDATAITTMFQKRWEKPKAGKEHNDRRVAFAIEFEAPAPALEQQQEQEQVVDVNASSTDTPAQQATHTVADNDTLYNIAKRSGMSVEDLQAINPEVTDHTNLQLGQQLRVGNDWFEEL